MKILKYLITVFVTVFVIVFAGNAVAEEIECKEIKGMISSELVAEFPNGDLCEDRSPIGLCTVGKYKGGLRGKFEFATIELIGVQFIVGEIRFVSKKGGTMVLTTAYGASFDSFVPPVGVYGGVESITPDSGTGNLEGYSGRIRSQGNFIVGCVNCKYEGEICRPVTNGKRSRGWRIKG